MHDLVLIVSTKFNCLRSGVLSTFCGLFSDNQGFSKKAVYLDVPDFESVKQHLMENHFNSIKDIGELNSTEISKHKQILVLFGSLGDSRFIKRIQEFNPDFIHVGDWPLLYRLSLFNTGEIFRGLGGYLIDIIRLIKLKKHLRLIFVTARDTEASIRFGFLKSVTVPIGCISKSLFSAMDSTNSFKINRKCLCFSGNFDYKPNLNAAVSLIGFASANRDIVDSVCFVGFNAGKLEVFKRKYSNIHVYSDVESVPGALQGCGIYVSLISQGSGQKNKLLDALIAEVPIIATKETISGFEDLKKTIFVIENVGRLRELIVEIQEMDIGELRAIVINGFNCARNNYSWEISKQKLNNLIQMLN